jgi:predicted DNA binding CopG/RHH family protein
MKYTKDELELLENIENKKVESVDFDNEKLKNMATQTLELLNEKKQISINLKRSDLEYIKQRANDIGISYQNIIQALIHNYVTNKIKLEI